VKTARAAGDPFGGSTSDARFSLSSAGATDAVLELTRRTKLRERLERSGGADVGRVTNIHPATMHYLLTVAAYRHLRACGESSMTLSANEMIQAAQCLQTASTDPETQPAQDYSFRANEHFTLWATTELSVVLAAALPLLNILDFVCRVAVSLRDAAPLNLVATLLWLGACAFPTAGVPTLVTFVAVIMVAAAKARPKASAATRCALPQGAAEFRSAAALELADACTGQNVVAMVAATSALRSLQCSLRRLVVTPREAVARLTVAVAACIAGLFSMMLWPSVAYIAGLAVFWAPPRFAAVRTTATLEYACM
jgi:hypothetical protein